MENIYHMYFKKKKKSSSFCQVEKTWQNEVPYFELKNIYTTLSVPITDEYRTLVLSIEQNVTAGLSVENCQIQKDGNKLLVTFVISIFLNFNEKLDKLV